jgi:hypothetical protein
VPLNAETETGTQEWRQEGPTLPRRRPKRFEAIARCLLSFVVSSFSGKRRKRLSPAAPADGAREISSSKEPERRVCVCVREREKALAPPSASAARRQQERERVKKARCALPSTLRSPLVKKKSSLVSDDRASFNLPFPSCCACLHARQAKPFPLSADAAACAQSSFVFKAKELVVAAPSSSPSLSSKKREKGTALVPLFFSSFFSFRVNKEAFASFFPLQKAETDLKCRR